RSVNLGGKLKEISVVCKEEREVPWAPTVVVVHEPMGLSEAATHASLVGGRHEHGGGTEGIGHLG
ncbi:unnamed protein product, partial [Ilex paraguariensis]